MLSSPSTRTGAVYDATTWLLHGCRLDTGELLELAVDNGRGLQAQPLLQERSIGATEVVVEVQIALQLIINLQGRIRAVHPTLHRVADDKSHAAGAMVASRAIVADATPKLGEDEQHGVVRTAMLLQVVHEAPDSASDILPQL